MEYLLNSFGSWISMFLGISLFDLGGFQITLGTLLVGAAVTGGALLVFFKHD